MAGAAQNGVNGDANGAPSSYSAKYDLAPHFIGGNNLKVASPGKVRDFVAAHDGHTVITNVRENALQGELVVVLRDGALTIAFPAGPHCEQRYCRSQGNPLSAEMGLRDFWR
jgi:hypothetical protein